MIRPACAAFLLSLASSLALASPRAVDPALLAGLKARAIGPATMSGRIAAIDAVESNPAVIYVGVATGGVWKSADAGVTWAPIFDEEKVAAIGAVAVFQPNPDIVWVGTGEGNVRNSASVGWGLWRSRDGGRTWTHVGLERTERIHRIVLHPTDPDVAFVAAMGRMWGENPERGVFKTTDGGRTWSRVLYVDERTGCADLVADPANPDHLLAAMWEYRRWPWFFRSGGPGSGLYSTHDGGGTWRRVTADDGLPKGQLGRIGLAFSRSFPNVAYALVEAEKPALCRSEDGGRTWKKVNESPDVANRPFYYADIAVDPALPNRVYDLQTRLRVSDDGGRTFTGIAPFRSVHSDFHALWISPANPRHLIVGNDGGVAISHDRGASWRFVSNLPLAQYYHVNVDMEQPYNVYGGLQDNGSWRGPSAVWENGGIRNHHWQEVGFGDGFDVVPDPADALRGYSMSQQGYLRRWDLRTGETKDIRPAAPAGGTLRFNWNAAIAQDPFDAATIYYGSQHVHRSRDRGESWEIISPDLTTNNPEWQKQKESGGLTLDVSGAENFTTLVALAPSPLERGVIWAGSDDGRLHVSRDGGGSWTSVERNLRGVPANTWIPHVEASRHAAGTAYVVLDDHRRSNWTPYVYKTTDFGASWTSLATPDIWGYALVIEEDPVDPSLLFLGTEFGLWVSQDGGRTWWRFTAGVPTVSVMDLVVHPRDHDLVIATHGRSLFVVDDISPLRTLSPATMTEPLHLFPIPPAQQHRVRQTGGERFAGDTEFHGANRPYGALITFSLADESLPHPDEKAERARKEALAKPTPPPAPTARTTAGRARADESAPAIEQAAEAIAAPQEERAGENGKEREEGPRATITIADDTGALVRTFRPKITQGVNRVAWNLRRDSFKEPPTDEERWWEDNGGPEVPAGVYTVAIKHGAAKANAQVTVLPDPRFSIGEADRAARWAAITRAGALQETLTGAVIRLRDVRADVEVVRRKAKDRTATAGGAAAGEEDAATKELLAAAGTLEKRLLEVERLFRVPPGTRGIVDLGDAQRKIRYALGSLQSSWDAPSPAQRAYLAEAEQALARAVAALNELLMTEVAAFRQKVEAFGLSLLPASAPLEPPV